MRLLSGARLALLPGAKPDWLRSDVLEQLRALAPLPEGCEYQLACGDRIFEDGMQLGQLPVAQASGCSLVDLIAVVVPTAPAQDELDEALVCATHGLDSDRVAKLIDAGAGASFVRSRSNSAQSQRDRGGSADRAHSVDLRQCQTDGTARDEMSGALRTAIDRLSTTDDRPSVGACEAVIDALAATEADVGVNIVGALLTARSELLDTILESGRGLPDTSRSAVRGIARVRAECLPAQHSLHKAVRAKDLEGARALLDAGAVVDAVTTDRSPWDAGDGLPTEQTALHIACTNGDLPIVAMLMARGADVNAVRMRPEQDVDSSNGEVVKVPREPRTGRNPRQSSMSPHRTATAGASLIMETPLHIAVLAGNAELVAVLMCGGAKASCERILRQGLRVRHSSTESLCANDRSLLAAIDSEWGLAVRAKLPPDIWPDLAAAHALATGRALSPAANSPRCLDNAATLLLPGRGSSVDAISQGRRCRGVDGISFSHSRAGDPNTHQMHLPHPDSGVVVPPQAPLVRLDETTSLPETLNVIVELQTSADFGNLEDKILEKYQFIAKTRGLDVASFGAPTVTAMSASGAQLDAQVRESDFPVTFQATFSSRAPLNSPTSTCAPATGSTIGKSSASCAGLLSWSSSPRSPGPSPRFGLASPGAAARAVSASPTGSTRASPRSSPKSSLGRVSPKSSPRNSPRCVFATAAARHPLLL